MNTELLTAAKDKAAQEAGYNTFNALIVGDKKNIDNLIIEYDNIEVTDRLCVPHDSAYLDFYENLESFFEII